MSDIPPRQLFPNDGGLPPFEPAAILPAEFIQTDVVCAACRYNLRGQPRGGRCPECGVPVMDAFRFGQLTFCDEAWLRRVRSGIAIGFWTLVGGVLLTCIMGSLVMAVGFQPHAMQTITDTQEIMFLVFGVLLWVPLIILGMLVLRRLTAPEPRVNETGPFERSRPGRIALVLGWILIGLFVINMAVNWVLTSDDPFAFATSTTQIVYSVVSMVAWYGLMCAIFILVGIHLRSIARRDTSPGLGRLFTVVIWGSGVNLLTMLASSAFSLLAAQAFSAAVKAAASQAATQAGSHLTTMPHATFQSSTHFTASMPATAFVHRSSTHMNAIHDIVAPIMAVGGCFGFVWLILFVIAAIQFYRALSRAITHNVGMANVFAVHPPPIADHPPFGSV